MAVKGEGNGMVNTLLFSFSIIFQLSGAILLIINSFTSAKKNVTKEYFHRESFVKKADDTMERFLIEDKEKVRSTLYGIYMNRVSFIYLFCGYALAVVGENESDNKWVLAIALLIISLLLSLLTRKIIQMCAKRKSESSDYLLFDSKDVSQDAIVDVKYED
jgi:hypothetical protein